MSDIVSCVNCDKEGQENWCRYNCYRFDFHLKDCFKSKPKKKIIDLSMMIDNGIDMEFTEFDFINPNNNHIGKLVNIDNLTPSSHKYDCNALNSNWSKCRIRQDHFMYWRGNSTQPIPNGLQIEYITKKENRICTCNSNEPDWSGIIAFKILGPADGYKYEWMEE